MKNGIRKGLLPLLVLMCVTLFAVSVRAESDGKKKVRQTAAGSTYVSIEWDDLYTGTGEVLSQQITWGKSVVNQKEKTAELSEKVRKYRLTGLEANHTYWVQVNYKVRFRSGSTSTGSWGIYVNTRPKKMNIKAYDYAESHKGLRVAWEAPPSGENKYLSYEYQIVDSKGKKIRNGTVSYNFLELSYFKGWNKVCRIRIRPFTKNNTEVKTWYGPWSKYKALIPQPLVSTNSSKYGIQSDGTLKLAWKKVAGAKKYLVYISKNPRSGYTKVKTVKAGKKSTVKTTIRKFNGESFKRLQHYYVMVVTSAKYGKSGKVYYTDFYTYLALR